MVKLRRRERGFTALAMVTLNPAKELGIDHRVGTLEVGKDADIALFNGHPFDSFMLAAS